MYFSVIAKCGHVGRYNYVKKEFAVIAENGRDAAAMVRRIPRVKHDQKDAIVDVRKITEEEYLAIIERNDADDYFKSTSIQEQRICCSNIQDEVIREESTLEDEPERKPISIKKHKLAKQKNKEQLRSLRDYYFYDDEEDDELAEW